MSQNFSFEFGRVLVVNRGEGKNKKNAISVDPNETVSSESTLFAKLFGSVCWDDRINKLLEIS